MTDPHRVKGFSPGSMTPRAEGLNPNSAHRHLLDFRKSKEGQERKQAALSDPEEGVTGD